MEKRAFILFNAKNKINNILQNLPELVHYLCSKKFEVEIYATQHFRDGFEKIKSLDKIYQLFVIIGGDGTLHETTNAFLTTKKNTPILYLPTGTVNDFASHLHLPTNIPDAIKLLEKQTTLKIDIGKINQQYFTYVASFGLFTKASYEASFDLKKSFGSLAYFMESLKDLPKITQGIELTMNINNNQEIISGTFLTGLIINSRSIAGFRNFFYQNEMNDGIFHLLLIPPQTGIDKIFLTIKSLLTGADESLNQSGFIYRNIKNITISSQQQLIWNIDGEIGPKSDAKIEVVNKALEIYAPLYKTTEGKQK